MLPSTPAEPDPSAPQREQPRRSGPRRTCVGCMQEAGPDELYRVLIVDDGSVHFDLRGRSLGRGAWVHAAPACLEKACRSGFARSFRMQVSVTPVELTQALQLAMEMRVEALLKTGARSRKLAVGTTAVADAMGHQKAHVLLLASDARAAASTREVAQAVAEGRAMVWGTKDQLGKIVGRTEVGVIAVVDRELALGLLRCSAVLQMPEPVAHVKAPKRMNRVDE